MYTVLEITVGHGPISEQKINTVGANVGDSDWPSCPSTKLPLFLFSDSGQGCMQNLGQGAK